MPDAVLVVEQLTAGHAAGVPVVNDVSLQLRHGEILAVLGANGAGKSTLLQAIAGTARLFGGRVLCRGADLAGAAPWQIARAGIATVPQRANVFAGMTVQENLALGACATNHAADISDVLAWFPDLAPKLRSRVSTLSGGTRQMVAIGRALLAQPLALLLDEPSAGLSPKLVHELFAALASLKQRVPILLVEQNVRAALAVADRAMLMAEGRVQHEARDAASIADTVLASAFLGGTVP